MGALFSAIFTGSLPFGGSIIGVLVLVVGAAFGGFWIVETEQISSLNGQVADLHCQIDGPTQSPPCTQNGFRAQISALNNNLATAHSTIGQLNGALDTQNAALVASQADEKTALARAQAAEAAGAARASEAKGLAAALAAQKPQSVSYADLVKLIQKVGP